MKVYDYGDRYQVRIYNSPVYKRDELEDIYDSVQDDFHMSDEERKEHSIRVSMNRTINQIYGIARANSWDLFVTFTFDPKVVDRSDYHKISVLTRRWLNHLKDRYCSDLKYLIVPELHEDGVNWHIHGLLANVEGLPLVDSGIAKKGKKIFNVPGWKYGFSTVSYVEDNNRVSMYMCKYITKELCTMTERRRRYWASQNCTRIDDVSTEGTCESQRLFFEQYGDMIEHVKGVKSPRGLIKYIEIDAQDLDL